MTENDFVKNCMCKSYIAYILLQLCIVCYTHSYIEGGTFL